MNRIGSTNCLRHMSVQILIAAAVSLLTLGEDAVAQDGGLDLREGGGKQWYKGNTHTHTLWSDGEVAPEWAVAWYKDHNYDFLCLSDHNVISDGSIVKWHPVLEGSALTSARVDELRERFGDDWVSEREVDGQRYMQLKTLPEIRRKFDESGKFLMIQAEEITGFGPSVHINVINSRELIAPGLGMSVPKFIDLVYAQVAEQSERYGVPMVAHIDHPNWGDGITAQEMVEAAAGRYFEVYNGHGGVHNWGIERRHYPPTDRHWDIVLSMQLKDGPEKPLYGFGTDDTHDYYEQRIGLANAGRGWTMVLAEALDSSAIVRAMERGHFYASSGVTLKSISADEKQYRVEIDAESGVTYTTQFIGTMKGFDESAEPVVDADGKVVARASHRYSDDIGQVLHETTDNPAAYKLTGNELYVRAKIVSSEEQENPFAKGDLETAWAPPFVTP